MKQQPKKEEHYKREVFVNPTTEPLRRAECLCLNCGNMKPEPDNCSTAATLYQLSKKDDVAMIITRCPIWTPKPAPQSGP